MTETEIWVQNGKERNVILEVFEQRYLKNGTFDDEGNSNHLF